MKPGWHEAPELIVEFIGLIESVAGDERVNRRSSG
jgi:hypothetical protein